MFVNKFRKLTDRVFWFYAVPSFVGYGAILLWVAVMRASSVVITLTAVIGVVASTFIALRGQRRDRLALYDAKKRACERAVEKIMLIPWLFMADGVKERESPSDQEHVIRTQRRNTLRTILDESYQDVN